MRRLNAVKDTKTENTKVVWHAAVGWLDRLSTSVSAIFFRLSIGFVVLLMIVMVYEVIMRYFVNKPSVWSLEMSTYSLVAIAWLAAGYTLKEGRHIRVDLVILHVGEKARVLLLMVASFLGTVYCGILTWQSLLLVMRSYELSAKSETPWAVPLAFPQFLVTSGVFVWGLRFLVETLDNVKRFFLVWRK